MARIVSLVVLVIILVAMAVLFLQVMAAFWLPLFLALLLAVVFRPLFNWMRHRFGNHIRLAASLTTTLILLIVLIPLLAMLVEAGYETQSLYQSAVPDPAASPHLTTADDPAPPADIRQLPEWASGRLADLAAHIGISLDRKELQNTFDSGIRDFFAPMALRTTQYAAQTLLGLIIMIVAVYYFLADGPHMVRAMFRLLPLESNHTQELVDEFYEVTRAIVAATLLAALVQGVFTGIGFYVADVGAVFLLSALTMLMTLMPIVGGAIVWVPVCIWLYAAEGRTAAAILLAIWCTAVVAVVDYAVRPLLLKGESNIHPLLGLLSVFGGMHLLSPIGIFIGPMAVAFLQTLANMVHGELNTLAREAGEPTSKTRTLP